MTGYGGTTAFKDDHNFVMHKERGIGFSKRYKILWFDIDWNMLDTVFRIQRNLTPAFAMEEHRV